MRDDEREHATFETTEKWIWSIHCIIYLKKSTLKKRKRAPKKALPAGRPYMLPSVFAM